MKIEKISGASGFGIDYHLRVLLHPLPFKYPSIAIAFLIRSVVKLKSKIAYLGLLYKRKLPKLEAKELSTLYYKVECLRQSHGFQFIIRKNQFLLLLLLKQHFL